MNFLPGTFKFRVNFEMFLVFVSSFLLLLATSSSYDAVFGGFNNTIDGALSSPISVGSLLDSQPDFQDDKNLFGVSFEGNEAELEREISVKNIFGRFDKVLGFSSSIVEISNFFGGLFGRASQFDIDDLMKEVTTQFNDVKLQLSTIYDHMKKQDVDAYRDVENALTAANHDVQVKNTLDLISRGLRLSDQLVIFAKGLLGQNSLSGDILAITGDLRKVY